MRRIPLVVTGALCASLACTSAFRLDAPDVNPAMVTPIHARALVAVHGVSRGRPPVPLGVGSGERVDADAFTAELVAKVKKALDALGVGVADDAPRAVELEATHVSARLAGLHYECTVDFNRRLGDGPAIGLQARSVASDVGAACSFALREAATTALADAPLRNYLEAP